MIEYDQNRAHGELNPQILYPKSLGDCQLYAENVQMETLDHVFVW